ncbi:MAG: glutamate--tRNA ligase [Bacteroidales bacterium]|nr:glutamate--tRNA ligase [Bacteroidales bacterium]
MSGKIRVRFAPSPTGPLHIGGVRTALFNYLFARKNHGTFILRIEDTDQTRYVEGAEKYIIESLGWCGIQIDEGVSVGGPHQSYRQSERKEIYIKYTEQLIKENNAYYAFDTPEEIEKLRKDFEAEKKTFSYDQSIRENKNLVKNSLTLGDEEAMKLVKNGVPYVVRFKTPAGKEVHADDIIRGHVTFNSSTIDDKVIFKSDGLPTYHLANIVDDHLMEITHVIRGEEWLPSLPFHVLLYEAFGWEKPYFAHLPLILKPNGQGKLSKRDGDKDGFPVFPLEWKAPNGDISSGYRESGYLPEAVVNMLAMLGWNPGTEDEILNIEQLVNLFSLEKVQKAGARFDPEKAKWFNHQYLTRKSDKELAELFIPVLEKNKVKFNSQKIEKICSLLKERAHFISDFWHQGYFFFVPPAGYDEKVISKFWKEDTPSLMKDISSIINPVKKFEAPALEQEIKEYIEKHNLGFGKIMNPLRLLLVGTNIGPHLFDIMELLGREETLRRIEKGLQQIKN